MSFDKREKIEKLEKQQWLSEEEWRGSCGVAEQPFLLKEQQRTALRASLYYQPALVVVKLKALRHYRVLMCSSFTPPALIASMALSPPGSTGQVLFFFEAVTFPDVFF